MPGINKKRIMQKAVKYNAALLEEAPDVAFKGHKQADLQAKLDRIEARRALRAQKQAEIDMMDAEDDTDHLEVEAMCVEIREGVEGAVEYGNDSGLYEAMGHVRKSQRKSGLHRGKKGGGNQ